MVPETKGTFTESQTLTVRVRVEGFREQGDRRIKTKEEIPSDGIKHPRKTNNWHIFSNSLLNLP
jgi:hypothetical protein